MFCVQKKWHELIGHCVKNVRSLQLCIEYYVYAHLSILQVIRQSKIEITVHIRERWLQKRLVRCRLKLVNVIVQNPRGWISKIHSLVDMLIICRLRLKYRIIGIANYVNSYVPNKFFDKLLLGQYHPLMRYTN